MAFVNWRCRTVYGTEKPCDLRDYIAESKQFDLVAILWPPRRAAPRR